MNDNMLPTDEELGLSTEVVKPRKTKKPKLFVTSPDGQELVIKHMAKHFRDALELHHHDAITTDEKNNRHWILDLNTPLTLWKKDATGQLVGTPTPIKPGPDSTICQRCELFTTCKHPFLTPFGAENPTITVVYEFTSSTEDERGESGTGGISKQLQDLWSAVGNRVKFPYKEIRWVPLLRCANRPIIENGKQVKRPVNNKTKANWCGIFAVQDLLLHPPVMVMPIGSITLGYFSYKSNAQDWGGKLLTYRGWPDDWLMEPKYSKPVDGKVPGHPIFGRHNPATKMAMTPIQSPGIIDATQNVKLKRIWQDSISNALKLAMTGLEPRQYLLPHYHITENPDEIIDTLQWLIDNPSVVAFDTETTGLKAFAEGESVVFVMLRWQDSLGPQSIGFPWDFPESPIKTHISRIAPFLNAALEASILIGHNIAFDALFATANFPGCDLDKLADACVYDTWHEAFVLRQARGTLSLDMMAYQHVPELGGYDEDFSILIELYRELLHPEEGGHYAKCPPEFRDSHLKAYVMGDVEVTYRTHEVLREKLADCKTYKIPLAHPTQRGKFRWYKTPSRLAVYDKIVSPAARALIKMMGRGLTVDLKELQFQEEMFPQLIFEARKKLREITPEVLEWCEHQEAQTPGWFLDLESKDHLKTILFTIMKLPIKALTTAGQNWCRENASKIDHYLGDITKIEERIRRMSHDDVDFKIKWNEHMKRVAIDKFSLNILSAENPRVRPLLEYRSIFKQYASYIRPIRNITTQGIDKKERKQDQHLARDGRVHAQFLITGTRSGRLSSSNPNLQNLPSRGQVKRIYVSRFGKRGALYQGDLSQIELRLIAAACGDEAMVDAYVKGIDLHSLTMSRIFNMPYEHCIKDHVSALQKAGHDKEAKDCEMKRKLSKCVDLDTLVSVNGRITRVGDLHRGRDEDTFYPLSGQIQGPLGPIPLKSFYSNGVKNRLLICSKRGIIACSEEHPLLMADGTLKKAKNIVVDDVLAEPIAMPCGEDNPLVSFNPARLRPITNLFKVHVNLDLAYLLGLFYGDGECGSHIGICFGGTPEFFEWQDVVVKAIQKCGFETRLERTTWDHRVDGPKTIQSGPSKGTVVRGASGHVAFGSTRVQDIFIQLGAIVLTDKTDLGRQRSLKIPTWLFNATKDLKIQFLAGWFDTDGSIRQGSLCGLTKSWVFAQDICVLMASIGMKFSIKPGWNKTYERYYYRITVSLPYTWDFFNNQLKHPDKKVILRPPRATSHQFKPNVCTTIIQLPPGHVVDVEVDTPEHLFVANNLCQKNTLNFLTGYGGGAQGLQGTLAQDGIYNDLEKCEAFLGAFFDSYPALREYLAYYKGFISDNGVAVSMFGRVRIFEEVGSSDTGLKSKALRAGCNHLIQATASDMMLICICAIETLMRDAGLESRLISTVHDSLLIDCVRHELPQIHEITMGVFTNIPDILDIWLEGVADLSWTRMLPYDGDCEVGHNMLDLIKLDKNANDWDEVIKRIDED